MTKNHNIVLIVTMYGHFTVPPGHEIINKMACLHKEMGSAYLGNLPALNRLSVVNATF